MARHRQGDPLESDFRDNREDMTTMNGNPKWLVTLVSISIVTILGLIGTLLKIDRDRIELTAMEAHVLATRNEMQVEVLKTKLVAIQVTLDKIENAVTKKDRP
jgi:hypothetical protein